MCVQSSSIHVHIHMYIKYISGSLYIAININIEKNKFHLFLDWTLRLCKSSLKTNEERQVRMPEHEKRELIKKRAKKN